MSRKGAEDAEGRGEMLNILSYGVIGAAIDVHRELGPGFLEATYQKAMEVELRLRRIAFESQKPIKTYYKGYEVLPSHAG